MFAFSLKTDCKMGFGAVKKKKQKKGLGEDVEARISWEPQI